VLDEPALHLIKPKVVRVELRTRAREKSGLCQLVVVRGRIPWEGNEPFELRVKHVRMGARRLYAGLRRSE
jgi:hypothetical protein